MAKTFDREAAEREANEIAFQFRNSHDVVGDMSRAYHTDFSGIRMHEDAAAQARVNAAGTDALAKGSDLYFKKGILDGADQASRGLLAHELAHTMQQGIVGGEVSESAPAGAEQGGFLDWIKGAFKRKPKRSAQYLGGAKATDEESLSYMAAMKKRESELLEKRRAEAMASLGSVKNGTQEKAFGGFKGDAQAYMHHLEDSGVDFPQMVQNMQSYRIGNGGEYKINDPIAGMIGDMFTLLSNYSMSDSGLDYFENLVDGGKDASSMDDAMERMLSEQYLNLGGAWNSHRATGAYGRTSEEVKSALVFEAPKNLLVPLRMANISEEERQALPPQAQSLYAQYTDIKKRLAEALGARKAAKGAAV